MIFYNVEPIPGHTSVYQQSDPPSANLRRDSAELFVKEIIPPLKLILVSFEFNFYFCIYNLNELNNLTIKIILFQEPRSASLGRRYNKIIMY